MDIVYLKYSEILPIEILQSRDEGRDVDSYEQRLEKMDLTSDQLEEDSIVQILDEISRLEVKEDFTYVEPSELEPIRKERAQGPRRAKTKLEEDVLYDKILGAWQGRCSGCLLGQPVEGWYRDRIQGLAKDTGNFPITYYMSSDVSDEIRERYDIKDEGQIYGSNKINWINNVEHMVEDDDTNYTILSLAILEKYGLGFTSNDVATAWISNLPLLHTCTAERVAYKNIVNAIAPPQSAYFRNPYREWIGAQIRADFYGYIAPGYPELAAEMAWRDARISHTKNGIYGAMWVAAMLSAAAITDDIEEIIRIGLSEIPQNSRLNQKINEAMAWKEEGLSWEAAVDRVHSQYDETIGHDWCHTIPNAMIITLALLYSDRDFEKAIGIATLAAFDTDCNAATVGSIMGMIIGAGGLPAKWIDPLKDTIVSGVQGFHKVSISELASRTVPFANQTMDM